MWNYTSMLNIKDKDTTWQFINDILPVDMDYLIKDALNFEDEWKLDTSRQDQLKAHKDTEMYQLRYMSYYWELGQGNLSETVNTLRDPISQAIIENIYSYLESVYDGKVVRCEIVKMHGAGEIPPHIDSGEFLTLARRVHIPLVTNKGVLFSVLNSSINMEVGSWYEINNSLPHSVINNSDLDRIHIIIDILPNKHLGTLKN